MEKGVDFIGIAVVSLIHDGAGNYLLGLRTEKCRDEHNRWEFTGGGGLKFGEMAEDGIRRELKEELSLEPLEIKHIGFRQVLREKDGKPTHWLVIDYLVRVDPVEAKIMEPEMCAEIRRCDVHEPPQPTSSQYQVVVEKYKHIL